MVTALGVDNIIKIWREHKVRGKGASFNRAKTLVDAAHDSVGKSGGQGAVMEIQMLLEDYKVKKQQLEMVTSVMEEPKVVQRSASVVGRNCEKSYIR